MASVIQSPITQSLRANDNKYLPVLAIAGDLVTYVHIESPVLRCEVLVCGFDCGVRCKRGAGKYGERDVRTYEVIVRACCCRKHGVDMRCKRRMEMNRKQ